VALPDNELPEPDWEMCARLNTLERLIALIYGNEAAAMAEGQEWLVDLGRHLREWTAEKLHFPRTLTSQERVELALHTDSVVRRFVGIAENRRVALLANTAAQAKAPSGAA
jgi:hypothetical protein